MEEKEFDKIQNFNSIYTNNEINKLKILYSFLPDSTKKSLALYIKFYELKLVLFQPEPGKLPQYQNSDFTPNDSSNHFNTQKTFDKDTLQCLCEELTPFCNTNEKKSLKQIQDLVNTFDNMQEMFQTVQLIKEFMPDTNEETGNNTSPFGDVDISQIINFINTMST